MGVCCACLIIFSAGPREEACSFRDNQNQKKNTPPPIGDGTVLNKVGCEMGGYYWIGVI